MTCGIYKLNFGDIPYIGKSQKIEVRVANHMSKLRRGVHTAKLMELYNIFGEPSVEILLICSEENLHLYESICMDFYNSHTLGGNTIRASTGGSYLHGENSPTSKYSNELIEEVFFYLVNMPTLSSKDISNITEVSKYTIDSIRIGRSHGDWLKEKYPEKYSALMLDKSNTLKCGRGKTLLERGIVYPNIISPEGVSYKVDNTSQFAKEHGLNNGHLVQVLKGKERQHKGWRLE